MFLTQTLESFVNSAAALMKPRRCSFPSHHWALSHLLSFICVLYIYILGIEEIKNEQVKPTCDLSPCSFFISKTLIKGNYTEKLFFVVEKSVRSVADQRAAKQYKTHFTVFEL